MNTSNRPNRFTNLQSYCRALTLNADLGFSTVPSALQRFYAQREIMQSILPTGGGRAFYELEYIAIGSLQLLMKVQTPRGLFRKRVTDIEDGPQASMLWNTAFIVDNLTRSPVLRHLASTSIDRAMAQLSLEPPIREFNEDLDPTRLHVVPRSLPHILSLRLQQRKKGEVEGLLSYVFKSHSPSSFAFHEAEYFTLQLLLCLIDYSSGIEDEYWRRELCHYFASVMIEISHIVEQNGGFFCNEQFELKYNVMLLLVIDGLERLAFERSWRAELEAAGLHNPFLSHLRDLIVDKVLENLDHVIEETEYLLYLIEFIAHRIPTIPALDKCQSLFEKLVDILSSRYSENSGLQVTRSSKRPFTFLLFLAFRAFEGLLEYVPVNSQGEWQR